MGTTSPDGIAGFLRAEAGRLVDDLGRPAMSHGVGLGGWLLPEGYMWRMGQAGPQSPRALEAWIADLVGPVAAASFWRGYRDRFVAEADIERIARLGFDHVRLALNARLLQDDTGALIADGLADIDRCVAWGRRHGVRVLLDLHGAPGGQTGTNIDDSPHGRPDLFLVGGAYRDRTIELWRGLAVRYRDEPVVAGYDLLNEPLPFEYGERFARDLVALYRDLTDAIRAVDPNHCIVYEGTRWSTDWGIFTEAWDHNAALQFHRYWAPPDRPGIAPYREIGRRLGLPVYMGEGGENDTDWLRMAFGLYEDMGIGWNLWPWKKLDTRTSPVSVRPPAGWADLVAHAEGRGPRPAPEVAGGTFQALLDALALGKCDERPEVVNAVFRRAPSRFGAAAFDFRGPGVSYGTDTSAARPMTGFRSDEAVTIRFAGGDQARAPVFDHHPDGERTADDRLLVVLGAGEWLEYTLGLQDRARVHMCVTGSWDAPPRCSIGGVDVVLGSVAGGTAGPTAGALPAGRHAIRVTATVAGTVLETIDATLAPDGPDAHPGGSPPLVSGA